MIKQGGRAAALLLAICCCMGLTPAPAGAADASVRAVRHTQDGQVYYTFEAGSGAPLAAADRLDCTVTVRPQEGPIPERVTVRLDQPEGGVLSGFKFYAGTQGLERLQAGDASGALASLTVSGGTALQNRRMQLYALLEGRGLDGATVLWSLSSDSPLPSGVTIDRDSGQLSVGPIDREISCRVAAKAVPASGPLEGRDTFELPVRIIPATVRSAAIAVAGKQSDLTLNIPEGGRILAGGVTLTLAGSNLGWLHDDGGLRFAAKNGETGAEVPAVTFGNLRWTAGEETCTVTADAFIPRGAGAKSLIVTAFAGGGEIAAASPRVTLESLALSLAGPAEVRPGGIYTYRAQTESGYTVSWSVTGGQEGGEAAAITFQQNANALYLTIGASALAAAGVAEKALSVKAALASRDGVPASSAQVPILLTPSGAGDDVTVSAAGQGAVAAPPFFTGASPSVERAGKTVYIRGTVGPRYTVTVFPTPSGARTYRCRLFNGMTAEALALEDLSSGTLCTVGGLRITDDLTAAPSDLAVAMQAFEGERSGPVCLYRWSGVKLRALNTDGNVTDEIYPEETRTLGAAAGPVTMQGAISGDGRLYLSGGGTGARDVNLGLDAAQESGAEVTAILRTASASAGARAAVAGDPAVEKVSPLDVNDYELGQPIRLRIRKASGDFAQYQLHYQITSPGTPGGWQVYDDTAGITPDLAGLPDGDYDRALTIGMEAKIVDENGDERGAQQSLVYRARKLPSPTAAPYTASDAPATIYADTKITLMPGSAGPSNVSIFYTTDGSTPAVGPDNQPAGTTKKYQGPFAVGAGAMGQLVLRTLEKHDTVALETSRTATFLYNVAQRESIPEIWSIPPTSYESMARVARGNAIKFTCTLGKADIFYTTDGTIPDPDSPCASVLKYDPVKGVRMDPAKGESGMAIIAMARDISGQYRDSPVARFYFALPDAVGSVRAEPGEGKVAAGTQIALSSRTQDAEIFYEIAVGGLDAPDPDPEYSLLYKKPLAIGEETDIRAVAVKDGVESSVNTFHYTLADQIKAPAAPVADGAAMAPGSKLGIPLEEGMQIVYTLDGSDPTDPANKNVRRGAEIVLDGEAGGSVQLQYYIQQDGKQISDVVSVSYFVADPENAVTAAPPSGAAVRQGDRIVLSTTLTDTVFYYTTDGSDPTAFSQEGSVVTVSGEPGQPFVVKVIGVYAPHRIEVSSPGGDETQRVILDPDEGGGQIVTGPAPISLTYQIQERTPAPTASIPDGAVILPGVEVTLTTLEGDIFYTLDGSEPTSSSTLYTGPFPLSDSVTLRAAALAEGKALSETARYDYTLAGRAAAPRASEEGGALVTGTKVRLSSSTEGAEIFYTADGAEPTGTVTDGMLRYDGSPITVGRPVTLKMIALHDELSPSVVSSVTYTVVDPSDPAQDPGGEEAITEIDTLRSKRKAVSGPLYSGANDVQLRDAASGVLLSAPKSALPGAAKLRADLTEGTAAEKEAVVTGIGYDVAALYDVGVASEDGEDVAALGEMEVGLPIPAAARDGVVTVARIRDDGTVRALETRRDGGMAYAVTDAPGRFAVAVPPREAAAQTAAAMPAAPAVIGAVCLAAAGALAAGITLRRRHH